MVNENFSSVKRRLVALVLCLGFLTLTAPFPDRAEAACVIGVRANDVLNMRADATTASRIVSAIPPDRCGVTIIERSGNWLYVRYANREGWVSARYIGDSSGSPGGSACVIGVRRNDVLNIRHGRGTGTKIVGIIPPNGCGIRVLGQRGGWTRIQYRGVTGWVSSKFLSY